MSQAVKVLFASGSEAVIASTVERFRTLLPELPLIVVAEFAPPEGEWIPWHVKRTWRENRAWVRSKLGPSKTPSCRRNSGAAHAILGPARARVRLSAVVFPRVQRKRRALHAAPAQRSVDGSPHFMAREEFLQVATESRRMDLHPVLATRASEGISPPDLLSARAAAWKNERPRRDVPRRTRVREACRNLRRDSVAQWPRAARSLSAAHLRRR